MKILKSLILHEIRANTYNGRILIAFLILAALFGISFLTLAKNYESAVEDYLILSNDDPVFALRPPSAISVFGIGLSQELEAVYKLNYFKQIQVGETEKTDNPSFAMFEPPDSLYIFKIIVTLLALFFSFDAVSREKEQGTLKICLAYAVPRKTYVMGKIIGGFISLSLPCTMIFLFGLGLVMLIPSIELTGDMIISLLLFLFLSLLLIAVFISLGTLVSIVAGASGKSLILLISFWAIMTYFIPGFAASVARMVDAEQSSQEVDTKLTGYWAGGVYDLLQAHPNGDFTAEDRRRSNRSILAKTIVAENDYFSRVKHQAYIFGILGRLSPITAYISASTMVLGNGIQDVFRYKEEIRNHRNQSAEMDTDEIRVLFFSDNPLTQRLDDALPDIALLVITLVVLSTGAAMVFDRSRIT